MYILLCCFGRAKIIKNSLSNTWLMRCSASDARLNVNGHMDEQLGSIPEYSWTHFAGEKFIAGHRVRFLFLLFNIHHDWTQQIIIGRLFRYSCAAPHWCRPWSWHFGWLPLGLACTDTLADSRASCRCGDVVGCYHRRINIIVYLILWMVIYRVLWFDRWTQYFF